MITPKKIFKIVATSLLIATGLVIGVDRAGAQATNLVVVAKSYYVYDIANNKVLLEKNSHQQLPLASITKVYTALTALELLPAGTMIQVLPIDTLAEGDSGLIEGELWKLGDLVKYMLVASSNDASNAIGRQLSTYTNATGTVLMNSTAYDLGTRQTFFLNYNGLDISTTLSGGYGSARDVAMAMATLYKRHREVLSSTRYPSIVLTSNKASHLVNNTNQDVGQTTGILGSKTGFTDLAGGNLTVISDVSLGRPIVVVVLGSDRENRFIDMQNLLLEATNIIQI